MKISEIYKSEFQLEPLLPDLEEKEVQEIVRTCNCVFECDKIVKADDFPETKRVNQADAVVFYQMGYEAAQERINKILKPI